MLPLENVTVVSMEQAVAAPFATRQLADLGARVIKIERPDGGDFARNYDETVYGESSYFVWLNRSKESLTLDVKSEDGQRILHELLSETDVFCSNLGPGATSRLGLDPATLTRDYPRLIPVTISGYGTSGEWADRKAYDLLVQAEAGLVSVTGDGETIARAGISIADIAAGMYAYSGVLAALLHRASTGHAAPVEVSLFDSLAEWMGNPAYFTMYGGELPKRIGAQHAGIAPYGPYTTSDEKVIMLAVQNQREWKNFCETVMSAPELTERETFATNTARCAHRTELNSVIGARFAALTSREALDLLERARIANARVNTMAEFATHPALTSRDRWVPVDSPGGEVRALRPPADIDGLEPQMGPVPALGEHTASVLAGLGYSTEQIEALRSDGTV